jgi:hypothetical protein
VHPHFSHQCKAKNCRKIIDKDELRIGKRFPSARFEEGGEATDWFHPVRLTERSWRSPLGLKACIFDQLSRAKSTTKKIDSTADLQG